MSTRQDDWGKPLEQPEEYGAPLTMLPLVRDQLVYLGEGPVRVGYSPTAGWVNYGTAGRYLIPRWFVAMRDEPDVPKVFLLIVADDRGRFEVAEIAVVKRPDGPPVSGKALRDIPVDALMRAAMLEAAFENDPESPPEVQRLRRVRDVEKGRDAFFEAYQSATREPARRGVPVTDKRLREIAQAYRDAIKEKRPPKQAIAQAFHVSESTASRWIKTARDRDLLGPALPGRAGEYGEEETNG